MIKRTKKCLLVLLLVVTPLFFNATSTNAAQFDIRFNGGASSFDLGQIPNSNDLEIEYNFFLSPQVSNDLGQDSWTLEASLYTWPDSDMDLDISFNAINPISIGASPMNPPTTPNSVVLSNNETVVIASAGIGQGMGLWQFGSPITLSISDAELGNHSINLVWTLTTGEGYTDTYQSGIIFDLITPASIYTASFDSNGGSPVVDQEGLIFGDLITEPAPPTKSNFVFEGWYTDDGSFNNEWNFDTDTILGDTTLFAKWGTPPPASTYTATFNSNGGSPVADQTGLSLGGSITQPTQPTKANSVFKGWYTDDGSFNNEWNFDTDTIVGDTTLFAKWDLEGSTGEEKEKPTKPSKPTPPSKVTPTSQEKTSLSKKTPTKTGIDSSAVSIATAFAVGAGILIVSYRRKLNK